MCRRHLEVGEHDVRLRAYDLAQKLGRIRCEGDDLETGLSEQPCEPFPEQDRVLGDRNPKPHRRRRGNIGSCPQPRKAMRHVRREELVEALWEVQILQPMLAEIPKHDLWQDVVGENRVRPLALPCQTAAGSKLSLFRSAVRLRRDHPEKEER